MDESQTIRVELQEAAALLGIEKGSVKKRIQRGRLRSEKDARGITWVYLDRSETVRDQSQGRSETDRDELIGELRDRVRSLERRLDEERESRRRADTIIAQLTQANAALAARVPELEAPHDRARAPETVEEEREEAEPHPAAGEAQTATKPQQAPRPSEGQEHDASTLREWTGDVEARRRSDAGEAQEGAQRPWWRRMFGG